MVKCLPEFEYFTVFLKNKNIIFKIRRSKVTDYAALNLKKSIQNLRHISSRIEMKYVEFAAKSHRMF